MPKQPVKTWPGDFPGGSTPLDQYNDYFPGGSPPPGYTPGLQQPKTRPVSKTSILTGLMSAGDVTETRPGDRGNGATALVMRRLGRLEVRVSKIESTQ
jgi:hypothetical protein